MKIAAFVLTIILIPLTAMGQMNSNQNPPGVKWKKIDTLHFEVIFPEEITHEGQRVANTLEHLYVPLSRTLGVDMKRISVLLANRGAISNGYAALAPRMSEWFSTPPQSNFVGANEWYNLLASHEGRHMMQLDKTRQGVAEAAWILFGETGQLLLSAITIPPWFWEGDAVGTETTLSRSGRGRMPAFDMEIRTLLLSGQRYSYYKANFLSYKDRYPDHYHLGYLLTTYLGRKHGADVWNWVLDGASGFSLYTPAFAFSRALKTQTGKWIAGVYEEAMDELGNLWQEQLEGLSFTSARTLNTTQKASWTNYTLPQYMQDGSVIASRYSMADPTELIRILPDGRERKIKQFAPGVTVSVNGGKVAWDEIRFDPRWTARSYSVIVIHDLDTGKTKQITKKTRFYAPALSPNGKRIAVVEFTSERKCHLVILDAENGHEVKRFQNPENEFIRKPSWSLDGKRIVFTRQKMNGIAITMVDFDTGQMRDVIPHTWENIHTSSLHENYVFYNSSYSGIDNIYAIDLSTRQRYQVTSRKFGSFNPDISPDGTKLVFQDYTVKGYDVAEMLLEPSAWKPIEEIEDRNIRYYEPLIAQEQGRSILDEDMVPDVLYEVKNYNVFTNLVKFHTWSVLPTVPSGSMGIISNNELNTMSLGTGFDYNANEKVMGGWLNLSYAGFFPILDAGVSYGGRASSHDNGEEEKWTSWNELSARFGMRVPLVLSRGIYYSSLELGISAAYRDISDKIHVERFEDGNGVLMPLTYTLRYNRVRDASVRDFLPRWAQTARFSYSHTPGKRDYNGSIVFGDARLFFPGLFKHHSLKLGGAYERQEPDNYRFESRLLFPRGYSYRYHRELYKASVDYAFPLLYPDLDLGPLLYLKRIKGKFFYDHGVGRDGGNHIVYNSVGTEVSAEFNLFLLPISLDLGVRYSYRFKDNEHRVESIFLGATL